MERLGIKTIRELARLSNIDERLVGAYLRGDRFPDSRNILLLSQALDSTVESLMTSEDRRGKDRAGHIPHFADLAEAPPEDREPARNDLSETDFSLIHQAIKRKHGKADIFNLQISDSSMEPLIPKGCLVACKKERIDLSKLNKRKYKSAIWCFDAREMNEPVIRKARYRERENDVELIPINAMEYEIQHFRPRDVQILGRAIGIAWMDLA